MTVPATLWQPGMLLTPDRLLATDEQRGIVLVSFTSLTSFTQTVTFPEAFPAVPTGVDTEIQSGAGPTARWDTRAITVTSTGFTLFCYVTDAASAAATWASVPVFWRATY
ncbi:hypothetical protein [Streptomyces sp. NPDC058335]|uniref:hypothetical protein n=1 Tax=Streptomyces sp. NPDC058335 TaxID=3346451 RepID=UPI00364B8E95